LRISPDHIPPEHDPPAQKDPEVLGMLGTDPDDPRDLGAEIDLYMGKEMGKHAITKSTLVYLPANFLHCPSNTGTLEGHYKGGSHDENTLEVAS